MVIYNLRKPKRCILVWIFLTTLIMIPSGLHAQFKHISLKDGLSQSQIFTILQDKNGFIWFGTLDGLNKYDGYKFKIYKRQSKLSNTLSDNNILSLCEGNSGIIWIGTEGGGLNRFNPAKDEFKSYRHDANNAFSLSHDFIQVIYKDNAGTLWIGTDGGGLDRFNPSSETFQHFNLKSSENPVVLQNHITSIEEDNQGYLWIGTRGGLFKLNKRNHHVKVYKHHPNIAYSLIHDEINALLFDSTGILWIGTSNGLCRMRKDKQTFKWYKNVPDNPQSISHNHVKSIYEDSLGNLWIGTNGGGVNLLNGTTGLLKRHEADPTRADSISDSNVNVVYEDRSGVLWIGTDNGISKLSLRTKKFNHIKKHQSIPNSLSNNIVWSVWEDNNGFLWVGTDYGLNRIDRKTNSYNHFNDRSEKPFQLSHNIVRAVLEDRKGFLWIGTDGGGVNLMDPESRRIQWYVKDPLNKNSLSSNQIRTIYEDSRGIIWIGTLDGGLNRCDPGTKKFFLYKNDPENPFSINNNDVFYIFEDSKKTLWIGTLGGVNSFDRKTERFTHYEHDPGDPNSLSDNGVGVIYEDRTGDLWIGTDMGLNKFNRERKNFSHYSMENGLANDFIYGIVEDDQGNLWISTNGGISKFNPKTEIFRNYDIFDGLQSNEFNAGAHFKNKKGEIFFGGINGISHFFPEKITDNSYIPPVVLTSLKLFNKPVTHDQIKMKKGEIIFSYKQNFLSFEFAALDFNAPEKNQYAYKMDGFDKTWHKIGNKRDVTYTNLDPGKYTFRIKGSNNDNIWNEEGITVKIKIIPPFWQTLLFKILLVLMISGMVFLLAKARMSRIESQRKILETEVAKRTTQLKKVNRQQKKLLKELKESEEKYRRIFDNIRDVHFEENYNGGLLEISPSIEKISKYKRKELIGKPLFDFFAETEKREDFITELSRLGSLPDYETTLIDKDGRHVYCSINANLERDKSGKPYKIIGSMRDITERKLVAEERKNLEERLVRLEKMEAIGRLAGGVAHDLNNILSAIVSYPDLLLMNLPKDSPLRKSIITMQQSGQKANAIVHDLLTLARRGVASNEIINLNDIIKDYFKSPEFEKLIKFHPGIRIKKNLDKELFNIKGSPIHITKTVMNLISNAAEAMPKGGNIFMSTQNRYIDKPIKGYDQDIPEGDYINLRIIDEGIGISPGDLTKIFEPFYTKKVMGRSGTGLGMAVVWGTVKDCKGYINVESSEGEGSTFDLYFPITREELIKKKPHIPVDEYTGNGERILVVDDIKEQREITAMILSELNYSVHTAASGEEAIKYVKDNPVDLLILDMIMDPGIDGFETYKKILEIAPETKAIITSGFSETERVKEAQRLGAGEYVKKPYSMEKIGIAVKTELLTKNNRLFHG